MVTTLAQPELPLATRRDRPKIVLVDDDARMVRSIHDLLSDQDYDLKMLTSAREAVDYLAANRTDLVLLDLRMPELDGHQMMDIISTQGTDTGVVVISGERDIDAAIGAIKRGVYGYLRKPFHPEDLLTTVSQALHRKTLEAEKRDIQYQLECSERLYRYLVDTLPDIIYTIDLEGRFTYINDRAEQLLGYKRAELVGKHYSTLVHEDDLERARYVFQERRVGERASRNVELRLKSRNALMEERYFDNTLLTISFNATALYSVSEDKTRRELFGTYGVARDITELKRAEQRISYQAFYDVLTDLPNRVLFKDRLDLAIIHAKRNSSKIAVMFVDLDGFKPINDTLGHLKGDQLLREVAQRMRLNLRRGDTLARVGGDEFTVLLPDLRFPKDAAAIARKFLWSLKQPFQLDNQLVHISASIGIAIYPDDGETMEDLVRHADIAMYQMKTDGKNNFRFYDASMEIAASQKVALAQSLRQAIERNELEMYYQPQVDVSSGRIVAAEALMRWNHPERGTLSAGEFLPFAEENGLMLTLTDWMIRAVCNQLRVWNDAGLGIERVSLNLSPQCLDRGDIARKLLRWVAGAGIRPSQLEIEITESVCIRNPQQALNQLRKMANAGIGIAVDDFGTGYSSLAYLQQFPVKTLKIDRSFVKDIAHQDGHYPVVLAVISIAASIGVNVIAEGVETEGQSLYLKKAGCAIMQGYLYYKPMTAGQFYEQFQRARMRAASNDATWAP
ncbi:diguanylate cyclase [Noviherbaspirillum denitrificans]|uniref:Diguanylate cyclase n=2 Tax=Noviherbaspirillum denitrificans TaxID=1968433 RepID=A0A254TQC8_9BURK|nr:diguanylate cyclase [Noviherbaspirillum denitrificans]